MDDIKFIKKNADTALESFLADLDRQKLAALDKFLFMVLFRREQLMLSGKKTEAARLGGIIKKFADYQDVVYKKGKALGINGETLEERVYLPLNRLIFLVTHNCQLRCSYCKVRKHSASMSWGVMKKGIDLVMSSSRKDIQIQFFGGEPLLQFDLIKKGVLYAERLNKKLKKEINFVITTNGIALTGEAIDFFKKHRFVAECSLDGAIETQLKNRASDSGYNYFPLISKNFKMLRLSGVEHYLISVVSPDGVFNAFKNFKFLAGLGFKKIQLNYNLGVLWSDAQKKEFFRQNKKMIGYCRKNNIEFVNLTSQRTEPVVLNAEHTLDCDGDIYLESGICLEEDFYKMKRKFITASLKNKSLPKIWSRTPFQNFYGLVRAYEKGNNRFREIILNNIMFGLEYKRFLNKFTKVSNK